MYKQSRLEMICFETWLYKGHEARGLVCGEEEQDSNPLQAITNLLNFEWSLSSFRFKNININCWWHRYVVG